MKINKNITYNSKHKQYKIFKNNATRNKKIRL